MPRKAIPTRIRAALQKEVASVCPFCENSDVEHFEVHHIDEDPANNERGNLLLVCPVCHSKITKGDIAMEEVRRRKLELVAGTSVSKIASPAVSFTGTVGNVIVGNNNTVNVKQAAVKAPRQKNPEGCIGFDNLKANYLGYLIAQYNEYKAWELGKEGMNYAAFPSLLKRRLKLGPSRTIYNAPIERFEDLTEYVKQRIDGTVLAKVKKGKGQFKNYRSFEEYREHQAAPSQEV